MFRKNRTIIFGGIGAFFLLLLLVTIIVSNITQPNTSQKESPIPTPYPLANTANPPAIAELPKETGSSAIDTSAPVVKASENEVEKIYQLIPYLTDVQTPDGMRVSIVIPEKALQDDPWKLTVQVFGINYNVTPQESDYEKERSAFLFGAGHVFTWMRKNGVDPEKVIIKWGDRAFIQTRAEEWLKSRTTE